MYHIMCICIWIGIQPVSHTMLSNPYMHYYILISFWICGLPKRLKNTLFFLCCILDTYNCCHLSTTRLLKSCWIYSVSERCLKSPYEILSLCRVLSSVGENLLLDPIFWLKHTNHLKFIKGTPNWMEERPKAE